MYLKVIIFLVVTPIVLIQNSETVRVYFSKCGVNGFYCKTIARNDTSGNTYAVTYNCQKDDMILNINQFSSPNNIETLLIAKCENLTISFRCSDKRNNFAALRIKDVRNLKFDNYPHHTLLPEQVELENIAYIETIPSFTFSQWSDSQSNCGMQKQDFKMLFLKDITIETVQTNAFRLLNKVDLFTLENVRIKRIQTSAIIVKLSKTGKFLIQNSMMDRLEPLAFQIFGSNITFNNNKFIDIASSGINGTIKHFFFISNRINIVQSYFISILSTNVNILRNKMDYLKSNAFEKISPGLIEESSMNFGNLKFLYKFQENLVTYMDAGCLHPDYRAYANVATDILVERNIFLCSCINIRWMFPGIGHGHNSKYLNKFYDKILNSTSENMCLTSCNISLNMAMQKFLDTKCPEYDTNEFLCDVTRNIPTAPTPTFHWKSVTSFPTISAQLTGCSSINKCFLNYVLICILLSYSL